MWCSILYFDLLYILRHLIADIYILVCLGNRIGLEGLTYCTESNRALATDMIYLLRFHLLGRNYFSCISRASHSLEDFEECSLQWI